MTNDVTTRSLAEVSQEANALIDKELYQKALDTLQEARTLKGTPVEEADILYSTGNALLGLSRLPEAVTAFRKSADLYDAGEKRALALEQAAGAQYARRSFREAMELYRTAQQIYKAEHKPLGVAQVLRCIGNVQIDMDERPAARASFDEARKLYQEAGDVEGVALSAMSTASLLYETDGMEAAIKEYRKCIDEDKCEHQLALNNLGFLLTLQKQPDQARPYLERAETDLVARGLNDEDGGLLYLNLGNLALLEKRSADAIGYLNKALTHFAREGRSRAIEIIVLANEAQRAEGFEPYLLTDDGLKESVARLSLAAAYAAEKKLDEALAEARTAVELDSQAPYVYVGLGWIHVARGENDDAANAFRKAAGKDPNSQQIKKSLERANPYMSSKIGRNDACPCGSGKKFKKCHGGA